MKFETLDDGFVGVFYRHGTQNLRHASEIDKLEKEKTSIATVYALVLGIIGTAFMAEKYDEIYEICEKGNKLLY